VWIGSPGPRFSVEIRGNSPKPCDCRMAWRSH